MWNNHQHKNIFKSLIAVLLLGVFVWANYGVNFSYHHHQSEENTTKENLSTRHSDCYICHFQGLLYEPSLEAKLDFTAKNSTEKSAIISYYYAVFSDYYHSFILLRGPPFLG